MHSFTHRIAGAALLAAAAAPTVAQDVLVQAKRVVIAPGTVLEDSALLKVFGQAGRGLFPAPTVVAREVEEQYGVVRLAELEEVRDRFYAISPERKIHQPAVALLVERAKAALFG